MKLVYTQNEFFMAYAPQFNFELDSNQLIKKAIKVGFVTEVNKDRYKINLDYNPTKQ